MRRIIYFLIFILMLPVMLEAQLLYKKAEDFSLYSLDREYVRFSDFKDKPLLLFFWTSWCPYCRKALKELSYIYPELKNSGIDVLGINIAESQKKVEEFLKDYSIGFKILLDKEGDVAYRYRVLGVPYYVFIDREGRIKFQATYLPSNYRYILQDEE